MSGLVAVMDAVAAQLVEELGSTVEGLQVDPRLVFNPTPPCLDVFPGDPFGEATSFENGSEYLLTIRARVSTADHEAGQDVLLGLMDRGNGSVVSAIAADRTLGGTVDDSVCEGPSGYIAYGDASGAATGSLLGCEWRLRVER